MQAGSPLEDNNNNVRSSSADVAQSAYDRCMGLRMGEKRWACHYPGCTKRFARHDYLRNHCLTHEKVLGHDFASLPPKGVRYPVDDDATQDAIDLDNLLRDADQALDHTDAVRYEALQAGKYPCHYCEKIYEQSDRRKRHSRVHTGDKQYECHFSGCGMAFYRADHLDGHLKTHENAGQPAKLVAVSNAQSTGPASHARSLTNTSSQAALQRSSRPYSSSRTTTNGTFLVIDIGCELCGASFNRPADKKRHVLSMHVGQMPWACLQTHCGGCFATRDELLRHERSHQPLDDTAVEDHQYPKPNITSEGVAPRTSNPTTMAPRMYDKRFPCQHEGCGEVFKGPNKLLEHQKVHNDLRPFKCPICGKGLSRRDKLTVHIRLHGEHRVPPAVSTAPAALSTGATPTAGSPLFHVPRGRSPLSRQGQNYTCHLCDKKFDRSTDLKRHLASRIHQPRPHVPTDFPGAQCGKLFGRRADRDRHMASPNVHTNTWRTVEQHLKGRASLYAQACLGCGQTFTTETAFYSHAPCYRPAPDGMDYSSAEDGREVEEEKVEAELAVSKAPLDDFEAQLLAAAKGTSSGEEPIEERALVPQDGGTDNTSTRRATPASVEAMVPNSRLSYQVEQGFRTLAGSVAGSHALTRNRMEVISQPNVSEEAASATQHATAHWSRSTVPPQHSRLCYGCGKVFWDSRGFFIHSPCFTTTAESRTRPAELPVENLANNAVLPVPSTTPAHPYSSLASVGPVAANATAPKGKEEYLEKVVDVAPSSEVQRLLIALARNNPDARPIPPKELHQLTHREPDMLALVKKMERDNAELQLWLKTHQKERTFRHYKHPDRVVTSASAGRHAARMHWTCNVKEETMANIHCYAKPGEDLDWTKIPDRTERTLLQNRIKARRRGERELHAQGQSGSGGDYPGAEGVRGCLGKTLGSDQQAVGKRLREFYASDALKRKQQHDDTLGAESKPSPKKRAQALQYSLRTVTGLRLKDATNYGYEQIVEDDEP